MTTRSNPLTRGAPSSCTCGSPAPPRSSTTAVDTAPIRPRRTGAQARPARRVGILLGLEVSRLACNNADLDLGGMTDTLLG